MTVIGVAFDKILAERKVNPQGRINISNNISIKSVEQSTLFVGKDKQDALKFTYEYISSYEPNVAIIELLGSLVYVEEPKKVKEILQNWNKNKRLTPEIMKEVMDSVLNRCNIQAIILSKEISLPSPIPLPKVTVQGQESQAPPPATKNK